MPDIVIEVIQVCVIPLLGVIAKFIIDLINAKRDEIKLRTNNEKAKRYIDMIHDTITDCVIATEQTYVEELKKNGKFDAVSQKKALEHTLDAVMAVLNRDALKYIEETTNDTKVYLTQLIEAEIKKNK